MGNWGCNPYKWSCARTCPARSMLASWVLAPIARQVDQRWDWTARDSALSWIYHHGNTPGTWTGYTPKEKTQWEPWHSSIPWTVGESVSLGIFRNPEGKIRIARSMCSSSWAWCSLWHRCRDRYQGVTGCTPDSVPMVFIVFSRDSWGL